MAYSTQRVTSDGSLVLLSVSIGYLERDHIHVLFDNVENALPWAWVGPTSNQISFTPAVPNGVEVLIARVTDLSAPYHVFSQGAQFTAESLDEDIEQILYIAQEATEQASTGEYYQNINMHGFQVYNLGVTSDPTAAVSLGQYQADTLGANVAKVAAQASQADALVSKNAAAASEAAADISEANAAASAAAALVSKNAAGLSETNAAASAAAAAASYDSFDDRYLGAKASEPALDNDGAALVTGALFFHTGVGLKIWNGSLWVASSGGTAGLTGFTPTGTIAATNVQAAIAELDTEKVSKTGDTMTGTLQAPMLQAGVSVTPANNFVLNPSANNGTMKLARASGQDIMTVDAASKVNFTVGILGFSFGSSGTGHYIKVPSWLGGWTVQWGVGTTSALVYDFYYPTAFTTTGTFMLCCERSAAFTNSPGFLSCDSLSMIRGRVCVSNGATAPGTAEKNVAWLAIGK